MICDINHHNYLNQCALWISLASQNLGGADTRDYFNMNLVEKHNIWSQLYELELFNMVSWCEDVFSHLVYLMVHS